MKPPTCKQIGCAGISCKHYKPTDRKTLDKIFALVKTYDNYMVILNKDRHYVVVDTHDLNHEGKICNMEKIEIGWEAVKPIIEKQMESVKQKLKELGFIMEKEEARNE